MGNHPFYSFARRTSDYLRACQVVAPDMTVPLQASGGTRSGVLEVRELAGDERPHRYVVRAALDGVKPAVHVATENGSSAGPFVAGDYFRLFRGAHVNERQHEGLESETDYARRLGRKYFALIQRELRALSPRRGLRLLEGVRDLGLYYLARRARVGTLTPLDDVIGITWRVDYVSEERVELSCYDRGGILDFFTNAEVEKLPPQVMGTLYADAYSAWVFACRWTDESDEEFHAACVEALSFVARTYRSYDVCRTMAHHADFKNAGLLETLELVGDSLPATLRAELHSIAGSLREDLYLPTNVFALRHHWKTAQQVAGFGDVTDAQRERIRRRIARDVSASGLIHDNNPGRFYFDSHDLTYHQYSLACLADSLRRADDPALEELFLRGVAFSAAALTPDGEVAYMGRGGNNVYHMASAIAAFANAASRLYTRDAELSARYRRAAELVFAYLRRAQRESGMLPVAVNDQPDLRMAWNHCHTPYNALSSYFLVRAARDLERLGETESNARIASESWNRFERLEGSRFTFVTRRGYYATHFAGAERSYWWSAPNHFTGVPGLAMLGIGGHGALLPLLDGIVTDHPVGDDEPCGPGKLEPVDRDVPHLTVTRDGLRRTYLFLDDVILVVSRGGQRRHALRVPARDDGEWTSRPRWQDSFPTVTSTNGRVGVEWSVLACTESLAQEQQLDHFSNPRGFAALHRVGPMIGTSPAKSIIVVESIAPYVAPHAPPRLTAEIRDGRVEIVTPERLISITQEGVRLE